MHVSEPAPKEYGMLMRVTSRLTRMVGVVDDDGTEFQKAWLTLKVFALCEQRKRNSEALALHLLKYKQGCPATICDCHERTFYYVEISSTGP